MKLVNKIFLVAGICLTGTLVASAQDDILVGKPIYTLGEAKTWTSTEDATYTFKTEDLTKLVATPTNTSNVYLFPEDGGKYNTADNKVIGIQGFYVDMGAVKSVDKVSTTWEGAAANNFDIYLTNDEPTLAVLETEPTYTATGLGQYHSNTVDLPEGAKGRYLVFQATDATNWGWGVKIRSIHAYAPTLDILTTFTVTPGLIKLGEPVELTLSILNQYGFDIAEDVEMSVEGDGEISFEDNKLTIISGTKAEFTATLDDVTLTSTVYAISQAPGSPDASDIFVPVYTNTVTDKNDKYGVVVAYNGGAKNLGEITFDNGEVAHLYGDVRCIFFHNTETTGVWDADINPTEKDYGWLKLSIFPAKDCKVNVEFERTTVIGNNHMFDLIGGQWNNIAVTLKGETVLHTMSVRFDADNMTDLALANIYFVEDTDQIATSIHLTSDLDYIASDAEVTLTASVLDQLGGEMTCDDNIVYTIVTDGVDGEIVDGVLKLTDILLDDASFVFTVEAALEHDPSVNGTLDIHVVANLTNQYITPLGPITPSAITLHGKDHGQNPFAHKQINFDLSSEDKSLVIEFEERYNFSLIEIEWEAACPSDFTVHTVKQYGGIDTPTVDENGNPVLADPVLIHEVSGRAAGAAGQSRIDRIYFQQPTKNEAHQPQLLAVNETPVESNAMVGVKKLVVTPTAAADPVWGVKLNGINAYGSTTATGDTTGVESVSVAQPEQGSVDVYTLTGSLLRRGVERHSALDGLSNGIYVVGGQKMIKR